MSRLFCCTGIGIIAPRHLEGRLTLPTIEIHNANLNTIDAVNYVFAYGNNLTNLPAGNSGASGWLYQAVHPANANYRKQLFFGRPTSQTWQREMENGVWSSWKTMA